MGPGRPLEPPPRSAEQARIRDTILEHIGHGVRVPAVAGRRGEEANSGEPGPSLRVRRQATTRGAGGGAVRARSSRRMVAASRSSGSEPKAARSASRKSTAAAGAGAAASAAAARARARGLASLRKRRRCFEFQRFLMAFSDRPVNAREISFQRFPRTAWSDTSRKSSAAVQGVFTRCGSRWFCQRLCGNQMSHGALVLNHRVDLHIIGTASAR